MSLPDIKHMLKWSYEGVNFSMEGNGGEKCYNFLSPSQRIVETLFFAAIGCLEIYFASRRVRLPKDIPDSERPGDRTSRKVMLLVMSLTFGIELGFKFATRQMIWVLNPCHVITMIQIFLLVAPAGRFTMAVFRISMHCLSGASIAILFPVLNTRLLPFETEVYYVQHILILVIPYYLIRLGGVYTPEPLMDFSWDVLSLGILFLYHWSFMQPLSLLVKVNLNNMMCPAISDPFYGPWYRCIGSVHQTLCVLLHGKVYTWLVSFLLPVRRLEEECGRQGVKAGRGDELSSRQPELTVDSNGHAKLH